MQGQPFTSLLKLYSISLFGSGPLPLVRNAFVLSWSDSSFKSHLSYYLFEVASPVGANTSAKHICAFMLLCIDHIGLKSFHFSST